MSFRDTRSSRDLTHLSVDQIAGRRGVGRGIGSRSPSPTPHLGAKFFTPATAELQEEDRDEAFADAEDNSTTMGPIPADTPADELRRIAEQAQHENGVLKSQQDRLTTALEAATAALQALSHSQPSAAAAAANLNKRKRPDLPAFDKQNIHIWLQRIEAAYAREEVTDPKQKFAFLESTIGVNMGPTINAFMFGDPTADNWSRFKQHLIDTFGPTKEQRCSAYLDGMKRDGRRPSDLLALIRDRGQQVTIDDLEKQLVLRELPPDVQKLLQDKVEGLDAAATASLADKHFDKDGRPLNAGSSINNINPTDRTTVPQQSDLVPADAHPDDQADINAVNSRSSRGPTQGRNNSRPNNSQYTPAFGSTPSSRGPRSASRPRQQQTSSATTTNQNPPQQEYSVCRIHSRDANSTVCQGPKCPRHYTASSCMNSTCPSHASWGNGKGGRR